MSTENGAAWDNRPPDTALPTDVVHYGPDIGTEADYRLCGDVRGKRVIELGCGPAQALVVFARQGAVAIGVDASADRLAEARRRAERESVRLELHHGDLAELAFVRADSVDLAFSAYALGHVPDLGRVFRQVHRVLKPNSALVFSLPHPAYRTVDDAEEPPVVRRSYFDRTPVDHDGVVDHHHTVSDLFTALSRANFRVDVILEPEPRPAGPRSEFWREAFRLLPPTLILRARKLGI